MGRPAFRLVSPEPVPSKDLERFWRDVDASDRLGSTVAAAGFLRALCRARAADEGEALGADEAFVVSREAELIAKVRDQGYRVGELA